MDTKSEEVYTQRPQRLSVYVQILMDWFHLCGKSWTKAGMADSFTMLL